MDRVWITWEIQRRNRTTSEALNAGLFELVYKVNRWLRYPLSIAKTLQVFFREKPKIIFAQNPSIILALMTVWYGRIFRIPTVIDAHNAGIHPFANQKQWANILAKNIMRTASLTIVTNEPLANYVIEKGGRPFVLPDPLPKLSPPPSLLSLKGKYNVLFICTWAEDEPYLEVLKAAAQLDENIVIYITGNSKNKESLLDIPLPTNVILTGYLEEERYINFLFSADVIIDLTTRDNCLVCGAYEAVSAEKPVILSDSAVLKSYFYKGALYTNNLSDDIALQITESLHKREDLTKNIQALKVELSQSWLKQQQDLELILKASESNTQH